MGCEQGPEAHGSGECMGLAERVRGWKAIPPTNKTGRSAASRASRTSTSRRVSGRGCLSNIPAVPQGWMVIFAAGVLMTFRLFAPTSITMKPV